MQSLGMAKDGENKTYYKSVIVTMVRAPDKQW